MFDLMEKPVPEPKSKKARVLAAAVAGQQVSDGDICGGAWAAVQLPPVAADLASDDAEGGGAPTDDHNMPHHQAALLMYVFSGCTVDRVRDRKDGRRSCAPRLQVICHGGCQKSRSLALWTKRLGPNAAQFFLGLMQLGTKYGPRTSLLRRTSKHVCEKALRGGMFGVMGPRTVPGTD